MGFVYIPLGTEVLVSGDLTLPDVTSSMWSYVSLIISWPPILAIIGVVIGLTLGVWVVQRILQLAGH